ncbi:MAG: hypothetical protein IKH01_06755 [Prevotella sp.]|nr:hypothetical protein [Prevotella sp.]
MRYKRKKRNAPIATLIKNNTNKKSRTPIYRHPYSVEICHLTYCTHKSLIG